MSEFKSGKNTFLERLDKGLLPAKSLNHASTAALDRAVAGQKLSFGLICCLFRPESGNVFSSSFLPMIALKYAPIWKNVYNFSNTVFFCKHISKNYSHIFIKIACFIINNK